MLSFNKPCIDSTLTLRAVIAGKHGYTRMLADGCSTIVLDRYKNYDRLAPEFHGLTVSPLGKRQAEAMRRCYARGRKPIETLWADLCNEQDEHVRGVCPLCGFGESTTMDHVLPKGEFPEYSVYPRNLVPVCSRCNTLKLDRWQGCNGRFFLHPYFDKVPEDPFLFVDILGVSERRVDIEYCVTPPSGVPQSLATVICRHFQELQLSKRYVTKAAGKITEFGKGAARVRNWGAQTFRESLTRESERTQDTWGPNHWEVALLVALSTSETYVEHLSKIAKGEIAAP